MDMIFKPLVDPPDYDDVDDDTLVSPLDPSLGSNFASRPLPPVPQERHVYYCLFGPSQPLPSYHAPSPSNPNLGRIPSRSLPPTRTVLSIKSYIAHLESFDPALISHVFARMSDEEPVGDNERLNIYASSGGGHGQIAEDPIALILREMPPGREDLRDAGPSESNQWQEQEVGTSSSTMSMSTTPPTLPRIQTSIERIGCSPSTSISTSISSASYPPFSTISQTLSQSDLESEATTTSDPYPYFLPPSSPSSPTSPFPSGLSQAQIREARKSINIVNSTQSMVSAAFSAATTLTIGHEPLLSDLEPHRVVSSQKPKGWKVAFLTKDSDLHFSSIDGKLVYGMTLRAGTSVYLDSLSLANQTDWLGDQWNSYRVIVRVTRHIGYIFSDRIKVFD